MSGRLTLGAQREIRIPETGINGVGELLGGAPPGPAARRSAATLSYAGLTTSGRRGGERRAPPRPYPLDLTIEAPARVFLRARGTRSGGSIG